MRKVYRIHTILMEVNIDSQGDEECDFLDEQEVKGCQDEYSNLDLAQKDFDKIKKY